jgi:MEKHLA domain
VYAEELFAAPFVIVSHDTQADPVLNYGNRAALTLWEMSWEELTRTPSRLTVEPVARCDGLRDLGAHQISVALVAVLSRPDGTAELLSPAVLM